MKMFHEFTHMTQALAQDVTIQPRELTLHSEHSAPKPCKPSRCRRICAQRSAERMLRMMKSA